MKKEKSTKKKLLQQDFRNIFKDLHKKITKERKKAKEFEMEQRILLILALVLTSKQKQKEERTEYRTQNEKKEIFSLKTEYSLNK